MPKKFVGENSKAVAARSRKADAKNQMDEKKRLAEEDAYWQDDDKTNQRKQQRKEEQERKRNDALQRKQANRVAHDEEMRQIGASPAGKMVETKVTQAQIAAMRQREIDARRREEEDRARAAAQARLEPALPELEDNVNRLALDEGSARCVTDAIAVLDGPSPLVDRHPEKRMRAAYQTFEDAHLARIKTENPTLRLSQLKQLVRKEWQKCPDNPVNQAMRAQQLSS